MSESRSEDFRLTRVTEICASLPEVTRSLSGDHAQFQARNRTFAYFLNNHHGDGIVAITCKVLAGDNIELTSRRPRDFYLPAYLGSRGWVALRLDLKAPDWEEVAELIHGSYKLVAPKRLAALLQD